MDYLHEADLEPQYKDYQLFFILKTQREANITKISDRIRGFIGVTIVQPQYSEKMEKKSALSDVYNFQLFKVKFITNQEPKAYSQGLLQQVKTIRGVDSYKPLLNTLKLI